MSILEEISQNLQAGRAKIVKELVQKALDDGIAVQDILDKGLLHGMNIVGEKFRLNQVYVPEVLVAARAMNWGVELLKPFFAASGVKSRGRVCIGTVQGDLHDIGKNLVKMMLEGKGFEVIDLGTDVPAETFINTIIEKNCAILCLSALLTTTMAAMADVVKKVEAAGIRNQVKIMVGGAPVTDEFRAEIGADAYAPDAASAADTALKLLRD
jgi:corrinoid protein of di/trimethylamine methyltransferase